MHQERLVQSHKGTAITVAIARFCRSCGIPRCAQFQLMLTRRRSMVETVFGLPPCRLANDIAGSTSGDAKADDLGAERFSRRHLQSEAQARGA